MRFSWSSGYAHCTVKDESEQGAGTSRRALLKTAAALSLGAAATKSMAGREARQAAFVLVHGAWHGGWCYARVAEMLRAQGHRVYSPTLTGLAERSHLAMTGVNCSTHIQDILDVIKWEQLHEVVLCGHSYGGVVIGAVADRIPERIASMVYLDAIIPENGMSAFDLGECEDVVRMIRSTGRYGGLLIPPAPAESFNVNPADRAMVDALCTPQPIATFSEALELTGAYMRIPRKTYVRATGWNSMASQRFHTRIKNDPDWVVADVSCGHDVMIDSPNRLAEILLEAA